MILYCSSLLPDQIDKIKGEEKLVLKDPVFPQVLRKRQFQIGKDIDWIKLKRT